MTRMTSMTQVTQMTWMTQITWMTQMTQMTQVTGWQEASQTIDCMVYSNEVEVLAAECQHPPRAW